MYYSTASPEQLRWILAPTTQLVELISRRSFSFESHAGYLSSDRTFLIAGSCAGVNFLITSFLMLSLRRLWNNSSQRRLGRFDWLFIPVAALSAYVATLVANTVRICVALQMREMHWEIDGLSANQLHRFEGIFVYFGFLLLLFIVTDRRREEVELSRPSWLRELVFPLSIYYLTTLGIPLANIAYHRGSVASDFWEHSLFVVLTPIPLLLLVAGFRWCRGLFEHIRGSGPTVREGVL
jgi:exosortase K